MKRELGIFERALVVSDRYAPFHSVYILRLEAPPPSQVVSRALKMVQNRHPFLKARLFLEKGKYFFTSLVDLSLPLHVLPRWNDDHWIKLVEVELAKRIELTADPMFRCTYLYDANQKNAEIILTFFQSIADPASARRLLDELLTTCASILEEKTVNAAGLSPAPPQESRFPSAFRGVRLQARSLGYVLRQSIDEITYRIQSQGKRTQPLHTKASHGHIISLTLPEPFVATLIHRAGLEKVMLDALLQAAMLVAVNRHLYAGKLLPMRTFSFWDMRPSVEPPLKREDIGCYLSPLRYTIPVEGGSNIWQLASALQRKFYHAIKRGDHFLAATKIESLLKKAMNRRTSRLSSTALHFGGDSLVKAGYGGIIVNDLHGYISAYDLGPEFPGQACFFNGQLIWDFTYLDADMSGDEAKAIVEEIKSILHSAVTSPLFSF